MAEGSAQGPRRGRGVNKHDHERRGQRSHKLEQSFARLLGRQPTEHERDRLRRIKDELGIADNDALWSVLLALNYHTALYEAMPARIEQAAEDAVRKVRGTALLVTSACLGIILLAPIAAIALR